MHVTIGIKIFGIAVGLLIMMAVVALLSMRMTRTVDDQLVIIDHNYFPTYVALAEAHIRSVEESAYARRLLLAIAAEPQDPAKRRALHCPRHLFANASNKRFPNQSVSSAAMAFGIRIAATIPTFVRLN